MRSMALLLACSLAACGPSDHTSDSTGGDGADAGEGGGGGGGGAAEACTKMDLLFVVDDSGSMVEEQENLAANFPGFVSVLDSYATSDGTPLDYRVAVTTSGRDVDYEVDPPAPDGFPIDPPAVPFSESGDNGAFRQTCGMSRRWLERGEANMSQTFSCAAEVGTGGPSIEMPLYVLELAFGARMGDGTNTGFLRDDALLGVVILTDEDDCSRPDNDFTVESDLCDPAWPEQPPISHFVEVLDTLKGGRTHWAAAMVAGPGPGDCESDFGAAIEAKRLGEFAGAVGANATVSSICDGDLSSGLASALDTFTAACENFGVD